MKYIVVNLSLTNQKQELFYYSEKGHNYTSIPFLADLYDENEIRLHESRLNNGITTKAIPATKVGLEEIGFKVQFKKNKLIKTDSNNENF